MSQKPNDLSSSPGVVYSIRNQAAIPQDSDCGIVLLKRLAAFVNVIVFQVRFVQLLVGLLNCLRLVSHFIHIPSTIYIGLSAHTYSFGVFEGKPPVPNN